MKRSFIRGGLRIALTLLMTALCSAAAAPGYKVLNTYKVGGDGGWDYLTADAAARRLYISRATHVIVLDLDSGKTVGDIADIDAVHPGHAAGLGRYNGRHQSGTRKHAGKQFLSREHGGSLEL